MHVNQEVCKFNEQSFFFVIVILLDWFETNQMQANTGKFQVISVGMKTYTDMKNIQIAEVNITCEESVKLLGDELYFKLNFDSQITKMRKKAAKQLNVLQRLSKF